MNRFTCILLLVITAFDVHAQTTETRCNKSIKEGGINTKIAAFTDETLTDLNLIAAKKGWTLDEAKADFSRNTLLGRLSEKLFKTHPTTFVGIVVSDDINELPKVYLKGSPDCVMNDWASGLNGKPNIDLIAEQLYSFVDLQKRQRQVHHTLRDEGFRDMATSFDIANEGQIEVRVRRDETRGMPAYDIRESLPSTIREQVTISIQDDPVSVRENAFGGMLALDGTTGLCTTGFSVKDGNGITGVALAGHCTGINKFRHLLWGHPTTLQASHQGIYGDIAWHTTGQLESATYYSNTNSIRPVNSVMSQTSLIVGDTVCNYGRFDDNRECSDIKNTSMICGISPEEQLVRMEEDITIFGDSGGPWSFGTKAYGIHVGTCGGDDVWTPVDLLQDAFGVTVITQ